ncbi:MAG: FHA domain-containing protein [Chloroflexota bacterium]
MTIDFLLLLLRIISSLLLIGLLFTLFVIIWREYRSMSVQVESRRRSYGQLVVLREIDGKLMLTGETFPLLPLTSLGRSPTNTIPINDTFASSEHALVAMRNGQWWIEDRKSRNGTLLNDLPITEAMVITHGDIISIGKMKFRLELEL